LSVRKIAGAGAVAKTTIPEIFNVVLCFVFVALTFMLYDKAVDFEHTYRTMVTDPYSFHIRQAYMRDKIVDIPPILFACVGLMLANLVWLISRTEWRPSLLRPRP
jgi:hypothetical protein